MATAAANIDMDKAKKTAEHVLEVCEVLWCSSEVMALIGERTLWRAYLS